MRGPQYGSHIRDEHDQRIVTLSGGVERVQHASYSVVHRCEQSEIAMFLRLIVCRPAVAFKVFTRHMPHRFLILVGHRVHCANVVWRIKRQVDEVWFAQSSLTLNEIASCVGEDVRAVAFDWEPLGPFENVVFALISVFEVMNVSRSAAQEFVETSLCRTAPGRKTDVPFAETCRRVIRIFQILRNQTFPVWQANTGPVFGCGKLVHEPMALRGCRPVSIAPRDGVQVAVTT